MDRSQQVRQPIITPMGKAVSVSSHTSRPKSLRSCRRVAPTARSIPMSSVLRASMLSMAEAMATQEESSSAPLRRTHRIT